MPTNERAGHTLETRFKVSILGWSGEWGAGGYLLLAGGVAVAAALSVVAVLALPFIVVAGHVLTACLAALLFDQRTGFNPLNIVQLIAPPHLTPPDILARWIYLPVLGLISFLAALPALGALSVEEPSGRHAAAAVSALASLLYLILLVAYPIVKIIYGPCLCADPRQAVMLATGDLRWGYVAALLLSLGIMFGNGVLQSVVPFRKWVGQPVYAVAPLYVTAVFPTAGATSVSLKPRVTATFNHSMQEAEIKEQTFQLRDPSNHGVPGKVGYDDITGEATFEPNEPLKPNTSYTAVIVGGKSGVKSRSGQWLAASYTWPFTTGSAVSIVTVVAANMPESGTKPRISVTFSGDMDATSFDSKTVTLMDENGTEVAASLGYLAEKRTLEIAPIKALSPGCSYKLTIKDQSGGVKDAWGCDLAASYSWTFTVKEQEQKRSEETKRTSAAGPGPVAASQQTQSASETPKSNGQHPPRYASDASRKTQAPPVDQLTAEPGGTAVAVPAPSATARSALRPQDLSTATADDAQPNVIVMDPDIGRVQVDVSELIPSPRPAGGQIETPHPSSGTQPNPQDSAQGAAQASTNIGQPSVNAAQPGTARPTMSFWQRLLLWFRGEPPTTSDSPPPPTAPQMPAYPLGAAPPTAAEPPSPQNQGTSQADTSTEGNTSGPDQPA